jgi:hypothetical protein
MDMTIPESGSQRQTSAIENLNALRNFDFSTLTHRTNPTVFYQHDAIVYRIVYR